MDIKKSFEILRLKPDASVEDLKLAYRDMVNVWHPDRFLHNPRLKEKAEKQLQEINQAYEIALKHFSSDVDADLKDKSGVAEKHSQSRPNARPVRKLRACFLPCRAGWFAFWQGVLMALYLH